MTLEELLKLDYPISADTALINLEHFASRNVGWHPEELKRWIEDKILLLAFAAGELPEYVEYGICDYLHFRLPAQAFSSWKHYSGYCDYPVPHPEYKNPETAYHTEDNLWIGKYGDLRRDLCRHLAEWM